MSKAVGWRKVIIFLIAVVAFCVVILWMDLRESGPILAVGTSLSMLAGAAIYGNIQKAKLNNHNNPVGRTQ